MNYIKISCMSDTELDNYISELELAIMLDAEEPDELAMALEESDLRASCARDSRVAQALGRDYSEAS